MTYIEYLYIYNKYMNITKPLNRSDNFKKLAEKRVNRAILCMKLIGNLSNKRVYEWNEDQVDKIFSTLKQVMDGNTMVSFHSTL